MKNASKTAFGAIMAGLSIALMISTAVIPFLSYAIPAICGVLITIMVIECDNKWATLVYASVSILSLIIIPDKSAGASYALIFGYYPIVKNIFENKLPKKLCKLFKLVLANIVLLASYYISLFFFGIDTEGIEWIAPFLTKWYVAPIIITFVSVFFLMYDTVLTRLSIIYKKKWQKKLRKTFK
ncbi:MAG: hypothetical protein E7536_00335 [Ruminococcaceae bacterium]|nr:hypothetical protein [Oscillospiraceae bacterium]